MMRINVLRMKDYCGYPDLTLKFGDFTCLVGPNGIGKTTILNAVSLLCSSLDFSQESKVAHPGAMRVKDDDRIKAFLKKNIRNVDEVNAAKGFLLEAVFEHGGKTFNVACNQDGWVRNELMSQPFWWLGSCYFAKFDSDMTNFQLRKELWPKFKAAWDAITGYPAVEPEIYSVAGLSRIGQAAEYVTSFKITKPSGKVHSRKSSAGEKKIQKALSQIVNLEELRQPDIVLVDNIEMHIHYKRHLLAIDELKSLFKDKQIISTTHSLSVINEYRPKEDIIDIEAILSEGANYAKEAVKDQKA